jgi:hypothetical protein
MTKAKNGVDKNLMNTVEALDQIGVNAHHNQQIGQDRNDRRHQADLNHDQPSDLEHPRS